LKKLLKKAFRILTGNHRGFPGTWWKICHRALSRENTVRNQTFPKILTHAAENNVKGVGV